MANRTRDIRPVSPTTTDHPDWLGSLFVGKGPPITDPGSDDVLDLVRDLVEAFEAEDLSWCHWKSNEALAASASGINDLDLLVRRDQVGRCRALLHRLGFVQALQHPSRRIPGVLDFHGHDARLGRPVHVHLHTQLVLGDDMTKNHRLPIEEEYLASCRPDGHFPVPAPEFEYVVFILRMVLKHCAWDAMLMLQGRLSSSERRELRQLSEQAPRQAAHALVDRLLPEVGGALFACCEAVIEAPGGARSRARVERALVVALEPYARRSSLVDVPLKATRRVYWLGRRWVAPRSRRKSLADGGLVVAVSGGDALRRQRLVADLDAWLCRDVAVHPMTFGARPRRAARRVRHLAAAGGLVLVPDHPATSGHRPVGFPRPDLELDLDRPCADTPDDPDHRVAGVDAPTAEERLAAARRTLWNRL